MYENSTLSHISFHWRAQVRYQLATLSPSDYSTVTLSGYLKENNKSKTVKAKIKAFNIKMMLTLAEQYWETSHYRDSLSNDRKWYCSVLKSVLCKREFQVCFYGNLCTYMTFNLLLYHELDEHLISDISWLFCYHWFL